MEPNWIVAWHSPIDLSQVPARVKKEAPTKNLMNRTPESRELLPFKQESRALLREKLLEQLKNQEPTPFWLVHSSLQELGLNWEQVQKYLLQAHLPVAPEPKKRAIFNAFAEPGAPPLAERRADFEKEQTTRYLDLSRRKIQVGSLTFSLVCPAKDERPTCRDCKWLLDFFLRAENRRCPACQLRRAWLLQEDPTGRLKWLASWEGEGLKIRQKLREKEMAFLADWNRREQEQWQMERSLCSPRYLAWSSTAPFLSWYLEQEAAWSLLDSLSPT